jgi:hypothetical protein
LVTYVWKSTWLGLHSLPYLSTWYQVCVCVCVCFREGGREREREKRERERMCWCMACTEKRMQAWYVYVCMAWYVYVCMARATVFDTV